MSPKDVSSGGKTAKNMLTPGRIAVLVVAALAIAFICVNTEEITIRLWIPEVTMPLWVALVGVFLAGAVCGGYVFRRRTR
ncbi:lipopolysaccharide assembly protein LapA domain-containing protein [Streptomyces sp. NPDC057136]|uniref:lipopolysaccharide assembly protein LapA domain-containing protein n=1 Tax=Streptomyces sp. NPDC057136 TaxID=3346029 RepID=UPI00362E8FAB